MPKTVTFHGKLMKAQIQAFDYLDDVDLPMVAEMIQNGEALVKFAVFVLPQSYNKYTAFSVAGKQVYYGTSFEEALKHASKYTDIPNLYIKVPTRFCKYFRVHLEAAVDKAKAAIANK